MKPELLCNEEGSPYCLSVHIGDGEIVSQLHYDKDSEEPLTIGFYHIPDSGVSCGDAISSINPDKLDGSLPFMEMNFKSLRALEVVKEWFSIDYHRAAVCMVEAKEATE